MSPSLARARKPFILTNVLIGGTIVAFALGVYAYSISAVQQDDFVGVSQSYHNVELTQGHLSLMSRICCLLLRSEKRSDLLKTRLENKRPSSRSRLYFLPTAICPLLLPPLLRRLKLFPRRLSRKRPPRLQRLPVAGYLSRGSEMSNGLKRGDGSTVKEMCLSGERLTWTG